MVNGSSRIDIIPQEGAMLISTDRLFLREMEQPDFCTLCLILQDENIMVRMCSKLDIFFKKRIGTTDSPLKRRLPVKTMHSTFLGQMRYIHSSKRRTQLPVKWHRETA